VDDGWQTARVNERSQGGYRRHARNAAAMWTALSRGSGALLVDTDEVRVVAPSAYHALRAIVLDPRTNRDATIGLIVDTVLGESGLTRRVVEDPSGELDLSGYGLVPRLRMTVMEREPGAVPNGWPDPDRLRVVAVTDVERLGVAEHILISVFPPPPGPDDPHGRIQPGRVLGIDGWRVWLGYREDVPAGAAYTYHDGSTVGLYQLGTLPEHRGNGIGRAVLSAILRAYPDHAVTLTATDQGRPLYDSLGFACRSDAVWWRPNHTGDDRAEGLR
jgi:GNAT superfamily N-acetyltransferase